MAWLKGVFSLISAFPRILQLIESIIAMFNEWKIEEENKKREAKMKGAVDEAKKTGDTSKIDDIFRHPNGDKNP